jgi:UPF0716 protein FxsA
VLVLALAVYVAAEVAAFVVVAEHIGVLLAVVLVLAISACGPLLVRRAGLGVLQRARVRLAQGESPSRDLLDGVVLLLGGALVCIPGFVGDVLGLALLVTPVRHLVIRYSGRALGRRLKHNFAPPGGRRRRYGPVVDVRGRARDHGASDLGGREIPGAGHPPHQGPPRQGPPRQDAADQCATDQGGPPLSPS